MKVVMMRILASVPPITLLTIQLTFSVGLALNFFGSSVSGISPVTFGRVFFFQAAHFFSKKSLAESRPVGFCEKNSHPT
jgi:hypothetical protein